MPRNAAARADPVDLVPHGLPVARRWLMARGVGRHALDNLVKSGELAPVRRGVYIRRGTRLTWEGAVCGLQRMGSGLVVGGRAALEERGRAHYVPLGFRTITLHGPTPLPSWIGALGLDERFVRRGAAWLREPAGPGSAPSFVTAMPWGDGARTISVSDPERALFEVLDDVPGGETFEHAEQLMQGLVDLSPARLRTLLLRTRSVKVKRLFFWLAERHGHFWARRLDPADFDLGRGKRALVKGGRWVGKYRIVVPEDMAAPDEYA